MYLFVYGTLKWEMIQHVMPQLASCFQFVTGGYVKGRLFEVEDYPGAVPSEEGRVFGDVLSIKPETADGVLAVLDEYEDYRNADVEHSLFRREEAEVYVPGADTLTAFIYWYNKPVDSLTEIVEGIYRRNT